MQADIAGVIALQRATPEAAQWLAGDYERLLAPEASPGFDEGVAVAEVCGRTLTKFVSASTVSGFIAWRSAAGECEILNLAVDAAVRRQGIGAALLGHVLERARNSGARRVFLEVRESNRPAQLFYTRYGFLPGGRRPRYYSQPEEDAVILSLALASATPHSLQG
jgi:ribosomal-protein-alanine acetyltransferase